LYTAYFASSFFAFSIATLFFSSLASITLLSFVFRDGSGFSLSGCAFFYPNMPRISSVINNLLLQVCCKKSANRAFLGGEVESPFFSWPRLASGFSRIFYLRGFLYGKKVKSSSAKKPFSSTSTLGIFPFYIQIGSKLRLSDLLFLIFSKLMT